jgi:hypothetical protein
MLDDTTQSDLEQLLGEVDNGWTNCRDIEVGVGGCLLREMYRVVGWHQYAAAHGGWLPYDTPLDTRVTNMIRALGFERAQAMYKWNDEQRSADAIKHRIKDALDGRCRV